MKKKGERSALSKIKSQWQVVPVFLSGIILIMLLINDLPTPPSPTRAVYCAAIARPFAVQHIESPVRSRSHHFKR